MSVSAVASAAPMLAQQAQAADPVAKPKLTAAQAKENIIQGSANLAITFIREIFTKEIDGLAAIANSGKSLPDGVDTYAVPVRAPVSGSPAPELMLISLRPKLILSENVPSTLKSDVSKLTGPQTALYNAVLSRSIHNIRAVTQNLLVFFHLARCEPQIKIEKRDGEKSTITYNFNESALLHSKVYKVVNQAPQKVLNFFK